MKLKYYLTFHAIERIQERFGALCAKYPQLKQWKRGDDTAAPRMVIDQLMEVSDENKSFINNSNYMVYLYERYGYDSVYTFLEYEPENLVFVLCKIPGKNMYGLVTVTPSSFRPIAKTVKYNKTARKEVKEEQKVEELFQSLSPLALEKVEEAARNYDEANPPSFKTPLKNPRILKRHF